MSIRRSATRRQRAQMTKLRRPTQRRRNLRSVPMCAARTQAVSQKRWTASTSTTIAAVTARERPAATSAKSAPMRISRLAGMKQSRRSRKHRPVSVRSFARRIPSTKAAPSAVWTARIQRTVMENSPRQIRKTACPSSLTMRVYIAKMMLT